MTIEQILKLGEMGFSKEDIIKLNQGTDVPGQEPEKADPEPEEKEPEQEEAKHEPDNDKYDMLNQTINNLIKTIQAGNIIGSENKAMPQQKPEDVLASIIAPPEKKKGR